MAPHLAPAFTFDDMPRYYVDIRTDGQLTRDEVGADLKDLDTTRAQAAQLLRERARNGDRVQLVCAATIRNARGEVVAVVEAGTRMDLHLRLTGPSRF